MPLTMIRTPTAKYLLFLGVLFYGLCASAQQTRVVAITGTVLDDSTSAPLSNVNVYIANTTLGCNTDEKGHFEIRNIPAGTHEIVVSRIGYAFYSARKSLIDTQTRSFEIRLKPMSIELGEMVVSAPDPTEWRKQLLRFSGLFLGTTRNAKQCKIVNPEVLDFKSEGPEFFEATARQPLEVDNVALGYRIQFLLRTFKYQGDILTYELLPKFTELKPSTLSQAAEWKLNRIAAFRGSLRHFLISLFKKQLTRDGYSIYHLDFLQAGQVRSARQLLTEDEILSEGPSPAQKAVRFGGFLEVEYWGEAENGYNLLHKSGTTGQVSWISLNYIAMTITDRGFIDEGFATKTFGYWAWKRMGDMLPLDFEPGEE